MSEIPSFLDGIDPESFLDLQEQMQTELESHYAKQNKLFEKDRDIYLSRLVDKMNAIEICLNQRNDDTLFLIKKTNHLASAAFEHYLNRLFAAPPSVNRPYYLSEALRFADDAQSELNIRQNGSKYIFEPDELGVRIGEILSLDNEQMAKQAIASMYENEISSVVEQFANKQ